MTFGVCVSNDAYGGVRGKIFDLDDPIQAEDYNDYVLGCVCFETIVHLEQGEQLTVTCIERDD